MSASNKAIVQRLFDRNRDPATMFELSSVDCVYHLPLSLSPVGDLRGEAGSQCWASLLTAFPDLQRTVDFQFTDDIHVVTRWTATATHQGEFMGIAATGKRFTLTGISIHRIAGGKIVEEWLECDCLSILRQLGVVPTFKFEPKVA